LPDFDPALWNRVKKTSEKNIRTVRDGLIRGSDIDAKVVATAQKNSGVIDPAGQIKISQADVFGIEQLEGVTIICNPPYGIRMKNKQDLSDFYKRLGDFLKQRCKNSTAYIYFGDRKYTKNIGLKSSQKWILSNGGLDGRLAKYELY
jgi:putative N6-adenine-specific DNA methylase